MLTEGGIDAALKLASLIVEEHRQYGTLGPLTPLAESILAADDVEAAAVPATGRAASSLQA